MSQPRLKQRLSQSNQCFGVFSSISDAVAIEQLALAGYDFIIFDLEHTLHSLKDVEIALLAARAAELDVLVRIPQGRYDLIAPLLDAGASGIVCAMVETPEQAQLLVERCYYAPLGMRGLNSTRLNSYATKDLAKSMIEANKQTVVVAMIETQLGVENALQIASTLGVDAVLEGAADLSQSLGVAWQTQHPSVRAAVTQIAQACEHAQSRFMAIPRTTEAVAQWQQSGVTNFVLGDDRSIMRNAHKAHIAQFKKELEQ
ncbi:MULTISPECIES: HpcH/HpaI aldolase family protein [Pseudoalteromonas]|uniref:Aldolase n=1 Tax=Pseudoalteromonas amylolytica TaxID=1859457 RepID=A0A1S1MKX8_9GAMM|nr:MULTISPECIES: aldolase/citrate lyase family protein [Pseudoalteromonas]OHU86903.1 aldolase [Pseudoalteromonas sp. JW3]OHU88388.1 aldolase [Pseudoalteromonas amylolytica]